MGWDLEVKKQLKYCGEDVYIAPHTIILNPDKVILYDRVRIDPFCYISTQLIAHSNTHICSGAKLIGGVQHIVTLEGNNFIGYDSGLFCASEDYSGNHGLVAEYWQENLVYRGNITLKNASGCASHSIIMPGVVLPIGCTIGAQSFVYKSNALTEWSVWLGNPLRFHKARVKTEGKIKDKWLNPVKV